MNIKPIVVLLAFSVLMLTACDESEINRDFYLSHVAAAPYEVEGLRRRILFCDECLKGNVCDLNDETQCRVITLPDRNKALNLAMIRPNTEAVFLLVDVAKTDVNGTSGEYHETPLMIAAYYGTQKHKQIAEYLISKGADVNSVSLSTDNTALLTAIWKNNIDFAIFLLKNGTNPSLTPKGEKIGYACNYAINRNRLNFIPVIPDCCSLVIHNSKSTDEMKSYCR
ncbi:ankyrin repeat domain-containing protein [Rahnella selenatireducens]|uniref:ankyrin repeat domain-containing protein n=1 Tax=Rahnella selenatireducens TaxID=3389797 RepID=UPI003969155B